MTDQSKASGATFLEKSHADGATSFGLKFPSGTELIFPFYSSDIQALITDLNTTAPWENIIRVTSGSQPWKNLAVCAENDRVHITGINRNLAGLMSIQIDNEMLVHCNQILRNGLGCDRK